MNGPARTWNAVVVGEEHRAGREPGGTSVSRRARRRPRRGAAATIPSRTSAGPAPTDRTPRPRSRPARTRAPGRHGSGHPPDTPSATRDRQRTTPPASRHGGREVQTQIELGLAGRQTIPSGGFQYLQLGVVMRRPEMLDIPRTTPRRVHDLHRRRTRRCLHRAHVGGHRPHLRTGT
jgi:hypothetical protein